MISFNQEDFNLSYIQQEADLFYLSTRFNYRIYGLKQKSCLSPISIRCCEDLESEIGPTLRTIIDFFRTNNLSIQFNQIINFRTRKGRYYDDKTFYIGVRRDIRQYPILVSCILKTIIYGLEDKTKINLSYRIPKIPTFS